MHIVHNARLLSAASAGVVLGAWRASGQSDRAALSPSPSPPRRARAEQWNLLVAPATKLASAIHAQVSLL